MLIRFTFENFLSFNKSSEFSLIANKERRLPSHLIKGEGLGILKTGVLYGANASGKSNFVKALDFSRRAILFGVKELDTINKHFKLEEENKSKPSIFSYEIKSKGKFYNYGFAVQLNENKIIEEWLYEIGQKEEKLIFERTLEQNGRHKISLGLKNISTHSKARFEVYKEDFIQSDHLLFLSEINRKSITEWQDAVDFKNVYDWFKEKLTILYPNSKFRGLSFIGDDKDLNNTFNNFLNVFQTGIDKITSEEIDLDKLDIPLEIKTSLKEELDKDVKESILFHLDEVPFSVNKKEGNYHVKKIKLQHNNTKGEHVSFDFEEESDGTKRLFDFIPALHSVQNSEQVFVIDELDRSLHSKLTKKIVELFLKLSEKNESQLVVTTHESLLLDLDFLRRDEIWFVEKNEQMSRLFSLDEFKVRNDKIIQKDYLLGRYGAIPIFKSFKNLVADE